MEKRKRIRRKKDANCRVGAAEIGKRRPSRGRDESDSVVKRSNTDAKNYDINPIIATASLAVLDTYRASWTSVHAHLTTAEGQKSSICPIEE